MLALSVLYLHIAVYLYTAVLQVTPAQSTSLSELGSSGQVGQLASLVGLGVPRSQGARSFLVYEESLSSRDVADELSRNVEIMHHIFSSEWDAENASWHEPKGVVYALVTFLKLSLGFPAVHWEQPDGARLQIFIKRKVRIDEDIKKPIVTLSFSDEDPTFAERFLTALSDLADDRLRKVMLRRSTQYSDYLTAQLATITDNEVRQAVAQSLAEQKKMMMLAGSNVPFAAEQIGRANAGRKPTSPQPWLVLLLGTVSGVAVGCFVLLFSWTRNAKIKLITAATVKDLWPIKIWTRSK